MKGLKQKLVNLKLSYKVGLGFFHPLFNFYWNFWATLVIPSKSYSRLYRTVRESIPKPSCDRRDKKRPYSLEG